MKRVPKPPAPPDLGAPQPFNLTGDGGHTAFVRNNPPRGREELAGALADARYLDWLDKRRDDLSSN